METKLINSSSIQDEDIFVCGNLVESRYHIILVTNKYERSSKYFSGVIIYKKIEYGPKIGTFYTDFSKGLYKLFKGKLELIQ